MLKLVKTSLAIAAASLVFSAVAKSEVSEARQNSCTVNKADEKGELRKKIRFVTADYRMTLQDNDGGVACDGEGLTRSAVMSNAMETGTLIVKLLPKREVNGGEKDTKTSYAQTSEKGLNDSAVVPAVHEAI